MASIRLGGDIRALTNHIRKLEQLDFKTINEALGQVVRTSTRMRFQQQKGPDEKPWKQSIRASQQGGVTLTDTAQLKNSIRSKADNDSFAVGTNVIHARRHQFGDKKPLTIKAKTSKGLRFKINGRWITKKQVKVQMPARPFLGINETDLDEIKGTLEDFIKDCEST